MTKEITYGIIIFAILTMLLAGLSVILGLDPYTDKKRKTIFGFIIILVFMLIMQNFCEYWLAEYFYAPTLRIFFAVLGYSLRPAIILVFAYLVYPTGKHTAAWILVLLNAFLHSTAFYSNLVFTISDNTWTPGPLRFWCMMTSGIVLAYLVGLVFFKFRSTQWRERVFHVFWMLLVLLGSLSDDLWNTDQWVDYLTVAVTLVTALSYLWFHQRFVREYEANFIEEQRMRLVMSQIQPHFIYNALSSIRSIEGNPEETKRAITEFANYIRVNLSALGGKELVPFKAEMDFVKDYVSLQARRFPGRFTVVYDINDDDFYVPPLTIQILVENAIHHGIVARYEPGTIVIHTHSAKKCHVITVSDDGVGFDTKKLEKTDRVGVRAVKNRLEYYFDGVVNIESTIGKGTTVTLYIPFGPAKNGAITDNTEGNNENNDRR